nr:MAG TPA: thymidylate synthase [Bacteriophage sp.]
MTKQYVALGKKILEQGKWVYNERTKTQCLTLIDETMEYDVGKGEFPLCTTRKSYFRQAIGEMLGYIRGYTSTEQFHQLGVHTWDANAANPAWTETEIGKAMIENGHDLGVIYGAAANAKTNINYLGSGLTFCSNDKLNTISVENGLGSRFVEIVNKIKEGKDDRGLIWSFWKPELFEFGCLRPCMYEHQFSLVGNDLYLSSTQRSQDYVLGGNFNMVQVYFLLWVMAKLTGKNPKIAKHRSINIHVYENQYELLKEQLSRQPFEPCALLCNKPITIESVLGICEKEEDNLHPNDFVVVNYQHHPAIKYPFTV